MYLVYNYWDAKVIIPQDPVVAYRQARVQIIYYQDLITFHKSTVYSTRRHRYRIAM